MFSLFILTIQHLLPLVQYGITDNKGMKGGEEGREGRKERGWKGERKEQSLHKEM